MNLSNIKLVFRREIRDQLRDRRTLFTIAVLPILLYPLMGMTFLQVVQFRKEHPARIWVDGIEHLDSLASNGHETIQPLIVPALSDSPDGQSANVYRFHSDYQDFDDQLIELILDHDESTEFYDAVEKLSQLDLDEQSSEKYQEPRDLIDRVLADNEIDAMIVIRPDANVRSPSTEDEAALNDEDESSSNVTDDFQGLPRLIVIADMSNEKSVTARSRIDRIIDRYRAALIQVNLEAKQISARDTHPFEVVNRDVAVDSNLSRSTALWAKVLTFVMLIWALTGAFYPAIDLCAGEKERGTLETLLSSPARRIEIVWGKLLTIMVFSMSTALLNLFSMGLTAAYSFGNLSAMGADAGGFSLSPPPLASITWLILALVPVSALFSAMSLAIAAFARSSKEGQYYLMPLLLVTLPLMILSVLPGAELDLGTSLIPVTGMMLLLQSLVEGDYADAFRYAAPVLGVTAAGCLFAIRWAVDQFNNESVLFRESERLGVGVWLRHLVRDRGLVPTAGEAVLCGLVILLIRFFANFFVTAPSSWNDLVTSTVVTLLALVATPALLMAIMLTRSPGRTLRLRLPQGERSRDRWLWWLTLPGAVLLACCMHPAIGWLSQVVVQLYPISPDLSASVEQIESVMDQAPNLFAIIALFALVPAVCEELAFRGFILSGLSTTGRKWMAILISSAFFGAAHGILQQSMVACFTGIILGYVAVQTRSIFPCVLYHLTHNALTVSVGRIPLDEITSSFWLSRVFRIDKLDEAISVAAYQPVAGTMMLLTGLVLLGLLSRLRMKDDDRLPIEGEDVDSQPVDQSLTPQANSSPVVTEEPQFVEDHVAKP